MAITTIMMMMMTTTTIMIYIVAPKPNPILKLAHNLALTPNFCQVSSFR